MLENKFDSPKLHFGVFVYASIFEEIKTELKENVGLQNQFTFAAILHQAIAVSRAIGVL